MTVEIDLDDVKWRAVSRRAYGLGLEAAAQKVEQWARMGAGGAGILDEGSKNLADAIRRIDPDKGY